MIFKYFHGSGNFITSSWVYFKKSYIYEEVDCLKKNKQTQGARFLPEVKKSNFFEGIFLSQNLIVLYVGRGKVCFAPLWRFSVGNLGGIFLSDICWRWITWSGNSLTDWLHYVRIFIKMHSLSSYLCLILWKKMLLMMMRSAIGGNRVRYVLLCTVYYYKYKVSWRPISSIRPNSFIISEWDKWLLKCWQMKT